jgi:hypothetical protein
MSLIYIKNISGPKMDPCGTPQVIDLKAEHELLN